MKDDLTIFLHIPKTGGTTLNKIFQKQFSQEELFDHNRFNGEITKLELLTLEEKEKVKAVSGHYIFGIHRHFSLPFNYFTMLRDPVERVVSSFYFLRDFKGYEHLKNSSLEEFVKFDPQAHNLQTLMVSGIHNSPDLPLAIQNLKTFKSVGITERFDDSLFLLKNVYGWKDIHYTKQNITKQRPSINEVPEHIIELIKKNNDLDFELYKVANKLLDDQLKKLTAVERSQLDKYKNERNSY
ncbi:sulfotransferase family 2 domain-containing protein [Mangrovibacillus sp. Mu-81]|jgi:hypothetical protein|uniref:sulfotransferase family 2 domain-containing protein n=1 Tax=Mangrovibacillus sp. Mu-81 TaxID=3121478 RepID=UPI002FE4EC64